MLIRVCDKCKNEIREPDGIYEVLGSELCEVCSAHLGEMVDLWIGKGYEFGSDHDIESAADISNGFEWHSQRLGFPPERGLYLVTVEFLNKNPYEGGEDYTSTMIRIAKFTGSPCWYKPGKEFGLIEESGGTVTAWAYLPEAYQRE